MFEECGIILSRTGDIFSETDSFGQSLVAEIIEPMISECKSLSHLSEEAKRLLTGTDAALTEIRAMEG